ncbi:hypothetical protein B1F73_25990 [Pseudomonas syringae]|uniref:Uncharacterized protein n=1 Tax=Pseudomonas syringae TaxID=317 RepID=A0AB37ZLQ6_PSESX|nr:MULTISPECIES: hypothetical protein [Pseudomonas]MBI6669919.1 hypothetical protein [Pseudomonas syringae]MBI6679646.1 hypothetical protein [Pseudomonas syringae]MBI6838968.1 hypothetical protein [Pseudomonas syringae]NAP05361.1 hypothetical protein [Pseudomonas syringae]NAP21298.1 hypothetical protein [Pseudomonas syringae]
MNYHEIQELSNFYFGDSYVLAIEEDIRSLTFKLEAVVLESHPMYEKPVTSEQYCYRKISLCFLNVDSFEWIDRRFIAFSDSSGETDYGNIDSFSSSDDGYTLSGDWGKVIVNGKAIKMAVTY